MLFYFMFKTLFVLKIFKCLSNFFGHIGKLLVKKYKASLKIYAVAAWERNNCDTHIAQYLKRSKGNKTMKCSQVIIEYNTRKSFPEKSYTKCDGER